LISTLITTVKSNLKTS